MTTTPLPEVPVLSALELTARWSDLLEPPVFGARSLWLAWLDGDGLMLPVITPVEDLPERPDPAVPTGLLDLHAAVTEASGGGWLHLAMALCRPGRPQVTPEDAVWAEALREGVGDQLDGSWSLHLAAGGTVTPMVNPPRWAWS
jgi:hypothetical protein